MTRVEIIIWLGLANLQDKVLQKSLRRAVSISPDIRTTLGQPHVALWACFFLGLWYQYELGHEKKIYNTHTISLLNWKKYIPYAKVKVFYPHTGNYQMQFPKNI